MGRTGTPLAVRTGAWIRSHREARGWSQGRLSLNMRTHPHFTSISDWERGEYPPSARHLIELGRVFDERPPAEDEDEEDPAMSDVLLRALGLAIESHLSRADA